MAALTALPPPRPPLLAGHVFVPLGDAKWRAIGWASLLRAAGAEVRADLPTRGGGGGGPGFAGAADEQAAPSGGAGTGGRRCVLLVQSDVRKQDVAGMAGMLERADARKVPVVSIEWLKQSLFSQTLADTSAHRPAFR